MKALLIIAAIAFVVMVVGGWFLFRDDGKDEDGNTKPQQDRSLWDD